MSVSRIGLYYSKKIGFCSMVVERYDWFELIYWKCGNWSGFSSVLKNEVYFFLDECSKSLIFKVFSAFREEKSKWVIFKIRFLFSRLSWHANRSFLKFCFYWFHLFLVSHAYVDFHLLVLLVECQSSSSGKKFKFLLWYLLTNWFNEFSVYCKPAIIT